MRQDKQESEEVYYLQVSVAAKVFVVARLNDPDGIGAVTLRWRVDPITTFTDAAMHDDGLLSSNLVACHTSTLRTP